MVPSACPGLSFECKGGTAEARVLKLGDSVPGGLDALGTVGDVLIGNDKVVAVIDSIDNANFLAPSGGNLLDFGTRGGNDDGVNQILEVVGILPGDAVRWKTLEILESGPKLAAVQVRGELDLRPSIKVATRYEVRACEPGMRVRTEIINLSNDPELWYLADGYYWSGKEALAFTPGVNEGFRHDDFTLLTINDAFWIYPYVAWSSHSPPYASYATTGCNVSSLQGFNSGQISAAGMPRTIIPPRDYQIFERFIAATSSKDVAGGVDVALEVRRQLHEEAFITLKGTVVRPGGTPVGGAEHRAAVLAPGAMARSPSTFDGAPGAPKRAELACAGAREDVALRFAG